MGDFCGPSRRSWRTNSSTRSRLWQGQERARKSVGSRVRTLARLVPFAPTWCPCAFSTADYCPAEPRRALEHSESACQPHGYATRQLEQERGEHVERSPHQDLETGVGESGRLREQRASESWVNCLAKLRTFYLSSPLHQARPIRVARTWLQTPNPKGALPLRVFLLSSSLILTTLPLPI